VNSIQAINDLKTKDNDLYGLFYVMQSTSKHEKYFTHSMTNSKHKKTDANILGIRFLENNANLFI